RHREGLLKMWVDGCESVLVAPPNMARPQVASNLYAMAVSEKPISPSPRAYALMNPPASRIPTLHTKQGRSTRNDSRRSTCSTTSGKSRCSTKCLLWMMLTEADIHPAEWTGCGRDPRAPAIRAGPAQRIYCDNGAEFVRAVAERLRYWPGPGYA